MANEVFKRETLLDLVVNGIPLFILLFFTVFFLALPVFGFGGIEFWLHLGIIVASFVSLVVLSYLAAIAIVRAEESDTVYVPGQANVEGSKPIKEREDAKRLKAREGTLEPDDEEPAGELTDGVDERADDASESATERSGSR